MYNPFDKYLSYESHMRNYFDYIDHVYEPLFGIDDINNYNYKKEFEMQIKLLSELLNHQMAPGKKV